MRENLRELRPKLFKPSQKANRIFGNSPSQAISSEELSDTALFLAPSSSFRYNPQNVGVQSTQQLKVDWSLFENHTFFQSAKVKVNTAFDKVVNRFPFDGKQFEVEEFFDRLTGWERYVYDSFPKLKTYLPFTSNSYVSTTDAAGVNFEEISRNASGQSILGIGAYTPITIEFQLYPPNGPVTANQIVFQHQGPGGGYGFVATPTGAPQAFSGDFYFASGSSTISASVSFPKGSWSHVAGVWDHVGGTLTTYVDGESYSTNSGHTILGAISVDGQSLYFGSGSDAGSYTGTTFFSGAIDEFRIWHSQRTAQQIEENMLGSIFAQDDLKLYYKFNEPSGSGNVVVDSSGNSLHGVLSNTSTRAIPTASFAGESPLENERSDISPILFADNSEVQALRTLLLTSASFYDQRNPNLITRLVPAHLFEEAQNNIAEEPTVVEPFGSRLQSSEIMVLLLYLMADFFDEMKLYIQSFSTLEHVALTDDEGMPDEFLLEFAKRNGFEIPAFFANSSLSQFLEGKNLTETSGAFSTSLKELQNKIWRRILFDLPSMVRNKGTLHSLRSFLRSAGIEPDSVFKIREYGGPSTRTIKTSREAKTETSTMLQLYDGGEVSSTFLSGARVEPGFPTVYGSFITGSDGVNVGTNSAHDGLYTSGSWSFETVFSIDQEAQETNQSVVRFFTTGSVEETLYGNVVVSSGSVAWFFRPNTNSSSELLQLTVTSSISFNGSPWSVCIGRERGDSLGFATPSSSYFLRVAKHGAYDVMEQLTTSSFFDDYGASPSTNLLTLTSSNYNASGSFFRLGSASSSLNRLSIGTQCLLDPTVDSAARTSIFEGKVGHVRFWTKALTLSEWLEHVRNFRSLGVDNPLTNFNFVTTNSGSFEKLRLDVSTDQETKDSDVSGELTLTDFSQNQFDLSCIELTPEETVILPQRFDYSYISAKFDDRVTNNKVRIRSFQNAESFQGDDAEYAVVGEAYEIPRNQEPLDSNHVSIEFGLVDALNEDMVLMMKSLDTVESAIGQPNLKFSSDYPALEHLRDLYFNRLVGALNFRSLFEFYRWFDSSFANFLAQLLPMNVRFKGTNYVVESHILERAKVRYFFDQQFSSNGFRRNSNELRLQFLQGRLTR